MDAASLLDPERQFLGLLMQLPAAPARRLLAGMCPDDLADPLASHVLGLAIAAVAAGQNPDPITLFDHATETAEPPVADRIQRLAIWLADTHQHSGAASGGYLKTLVLKAAWRRAVHEHATRVAHATTTSPTEVLRELADDTGRADDLWTRYQAALGDSPAGRLGAVAA